VPRSTGVPRLVIQNRYGRQLRRAFAHAHVAHGKLTRIAPVGIECGVLLVSGHFHQILEHLAALRLANARDEILKTLIALAFRDESLRDPFDHNGTFLTALNRWRDRTIRVIEPLAAKEHLEVRYFAIGSVRLLP